MNENETDAAKALISDDRLTLTRFPTVPGDKGWMSVVRPAGRSTISGEVKQPPKLADLQVLVGGDIELILDRTTLTEPGIRVQVIANTDGRHLGLPTNSVATIWCEANMGVKFGLPLVGNVVILSGKPALMR